MKFIFIFIYLFSSEFPSRLMNSVKISFLMWNFERHWNTLVWVYDMFHKVHPTSCQESKNVLFNSELVLPLCEIISFSYIDRSYSRWDIFHAYIYMEKLDWLKSLYKKYDCCTTFICIYSHLIMNKFNYSEITSILIGLFMDDQILTWVWLEYLLLASRFTEGVPASIMRHRREEQYRYHLQDYKWHIITCICIQYLDILMVSSIISNEFISKENIKIIIKIFHVANWFANHLIKWNYARQNKSELNFMLNFELAGRWVI